MARVIAEVCTIYSASSNTFSGYVMYKLKGFIKDISILRKNRMQLRTRDLFEKIIFSLIRILRDITYENKEELWKLTETIKGA